jgi:hypothetical protein
LTEAAGMRDSGGSFFLGYTRRMLTGNKAVQARVAAPLVHDAQN